MELALPDRTPRPSDAPVVYRVQQDVIAPAATFLLPDLLGGLSAGARHVLLYSFFKIGPLPITPIFLLKAALFLFLLVTISHLVQRMLLGRLFRHLHIAESQKFALSRFATYTLFLGGLFIGVQSLGVNLNSLVVFGGALGVGVGLGLQNVVSNFVAGLILLVEQPIRMGDRVEVHSAGEPTFGDIVKIAARSTWVRTNDNFVIILPNSEFINNAVINWTANDQTVRINIPVGVGYNSDPDRVRELLLGVAHDNPAVLEDPAPDVIFTGFGDNSLDFTLRVWTESRVHTPSILKSDLYFSIFRLFSAHQIELPFPQRDLHIRSSDIPLPFQPAQPSAQTPSA